MATVEKKKCTKARLLYASKSQVEIIPLFFLFFIWARQPVKGHESKKGASRGSGASAISLPCMRQLAWKKTLLLTVKPSPDKAWSAVYYNDYPT